MAPRLRGVTREAGARGQKTHAGRSIGRHLVRLYSYIVTHDTGFAPNPFWGYCTLACCKPAIRSTARAGDWVVGLSPKSTGNRLVYAMLVDETIGYAQYFRDPRFANKIPNYAKGTVIWKAGDSIYKPLPGGDFQQLRSMHSNGEREHPETKAHDLGGRQVLIGRRFCYFGASGPQLPIVLAGLIVGRGHKSMFSRMTIANFLDFISSCPQGVNAPPTQWPIGDDSWRQQPA